ncbi:MAG TPA: tRNA lysidine(34) synthetase TilS [Bryobacteraceae bacterium]|nr:tRNA lysidine(34) synthetase TilS [Bryobacteraceae bacterium]
MLSSGQRVGVAVSGGADSVCLLHILNKIAPELGCSLQVIHLNHGLRGAESDEDAEFVTQLALQLGLPILREAVDLRATAGNLEEAGRQARLSLFRRLVQEQLVDRIATGHTMNDQAETVLYRLIRGSGTAGLAGLHPVAGTLVRPLIGCKRSEVEQYARAQGLSWRTDSSNLDLRFARNRIRHQLLPNILEDHNPSVVEVLAATANVARDEHAFWEAEIDRSSAELFEISANAVLFRADEFCRLSPAIQRRLLRRAIELVKGDLRTIGVVHIEQMLSLAQRSEGHGRTQASGIDVFRSFNWVRVSRVRVGPRQDYDYAFAVQPPCVIQLPHSNRVVHMELIEGQPENDSEQQATDKSSTYACHDYNEDALLDLHRLVGPLELRNWYPGDRYERVDGEQKVKQLFQRERIPLWERQGWPILTCGEKIVWSRRFGVSEEFAPGAASKQLLRIRETITTESSEPNAGVVASE